VRRRAGAGDGAAMVPAMARAVHRAVRPSPGLAAAAPRSARKERLRGPRARGATSGGARRRQCAPIRAARISPAEIRQGRSAAATRCRIGYPHCRSGKDSASNHWSIDETKGGPPPGLHSVAKTRSGWGFGSKFIRKPPGTPLARRNGSCASGRASADAPPPFPPGHRREPRRPRAARDRGPMREHRL